MRSAPVACIGLMVGDKGRSVQSLHHPALDRIYSAGHDEAELKP